MNTIKNMPYKIGKKDVDKAAETLGSSFIDYPIFKYVIPDEEYRKRNLKFLFAFLINSGMLHGEVIAPSKNIEGIAIWGYPNRAGISVFSALRAGIIPLLLRINIKTFRRFSKIGLKKQKKRTDILENGNYYFLDTIGINPKYQKKGYAASLLESKLREADQSQLPCYLETSTINNVNFYKQFGFDLIQEYELHGIKVYCMLRTISRAQMS